MKAVRYSEQKKAQVVKFILDYDAENGRGGKAAAHRKFNINQVTIAHWMKQAGHGSAAPKKATKPRSQAKAKPQGPLRVLKRMVDIQERITVLQGEFDELKAAI